MNVRNIKNRDITICGECKQYFNSDKLIPDLKNNRYLCDGCYEPRDQEKDIERDPEPEREKCRHCGEHVDECECEDIDDGDDIEEDKETLNPVRSIRGEARIERNARNQRARPSERDKLKSLIW